MDKILKIRIKKKTAFRTICVFKIDHIDPNPLKLDSISGNNTIPTGVRVSKSSINLIFYRTSMQFIS